MNIVLFRLVVVLALLLTSFSTTVISQDMEAEIPPQLWFFATGQNDGFADVDDYISPDFVWYSNGAFLAEGREGFLGLMSGYYGMFPDLELELVNFVATDDGIAYHAILHGTHTGDVTGMPPASGNTMALHYNSIMMLDADGRITELDMGFNGIEWAMALGQSPHDIAFIPAPMEDIAGLELSELPEVVQFFFNPEAVVDMDEATKYVSPDFVWYSNGADNYGHGVEGFLTTMGGYYYLFPDMVSVPYQVVAHDDFDLIAVRAIATATHLGELPDLPATGNELYFDYTMLFRLDDEGRILENWAGFDGIVWNGALGIPLVQEEVSDS